MQPDGTARTDTDTVRLIRPDTSISGSTTRRIVERQSQRTRTRRDHQQATRERDSALASGLDAKNRAERAEHRDVRSRLHAYAERTTNASRETCIALLPRLLPKHPENTGRDTLTSNYIQTHIALSNPCPSARIWRLRYGGCFARRGEWPRRQEFTGASEFEGAVGTELLA